MAALRLALILLLSLAGDLAVPPLLEAMDGVEESEEILHRSRNRRPLRPMQEAPVPSRVLQARAVSVPTAGRATRPTSPRTPPVGPGRKTPSPVPDSAPASDDH